jgi:hypothetical protein
VLRGRLRQQAAASNCLRMMGCVWVVLVGKSQHLAACRMYSRLCQSFTYDMEA